MKFEKVSFERFKEDIIKTFSMNESDEAVIDAIETAYDNIRLPKRATEGSAGYDFSVPFDVFINETDEEIMIPTGIRCQLDKDKVLMIFPRSSLGIKKKMYIANTVPVIDSDYYYADNEGHIFICIGVRKGELELAEGDRFAQGVIVPFGITEDDEATEKRTCGIGSTGV